jgi:hypothetical protein
MSRELTVKPVASGTEGDSELVRVQLRLLPEALVASLIDKGIEVVVCHGAVTDYRPDLLNEPPRGWPAGVNWNLVPGCYLPDEHKVAIATVTRGGIRKIPSFGDMHGSFNLVLHEMMHADDYMGDRLRSQNPHFLAAREKDKAVLTDYQRQDGIAGFEESYAETAARQFGGDPGFASQCANLSAFWANAVFPVSPGQVRRAAHGHDMIGTARALDDGAFELDLRADDHDAIAVGGHALVTVAPGSEAHAAISERRRRGVASPVMLLDPF